MDLNDIYYEHTRYTDEEEYRHYLFIEQQKETIIMNNNANEKQSQTQTGMILNYLNMGNRITALEALTLFGCMRLQARIFELVERGYNIGRQFIILENGKRVMQYWIVKD